jgi:uncharacterized protein
MPAFCTPCSIFGTHITTLFCRLPKKMHSPVYLPIPVVTEVSYLLQKYVGIQAMADFVEGLATTHMRLVTPESNDYRRAAEFARQYADAPLDFVDTLIVAVTERLEVTTILTTDRRHFHLVRPRHCVAFDILPG